MNLDNFWAYLTWHSLWQAIFGVVITAIITAAAKLLRSFVKQLYERSAQYIANSSKERARQRAYLLFEYYAYIWGKRRSMRQEPYVATLTVSTENSKVLLSGLTTIIGAILCGVSYSCFFKITNYAVPIMSTTFTVAGVSVFYIVRLSKLVLERQEMLEFDSFKLKTQRRILALRHSMQDDARLARMWKRYFEAEPPFSEAEPVSEEVENDQLDATRKA